jgi:O-antigen/teichoic acid export membrane protein
MTRIRINIATNVAGGAANALIGIVLVPFYLRYLGIEAYGLVGFSATIQAICALLQFGLGTTLNRGLARLSAVPGSGAQQRDLLRSIETVYAAGAVVAALAVMILAKPIAAHWLASTTLSRATVVSSIQLMGVIAALQLPIALYRAGLIGLERQVAMNALVTGGAMLRGFGALAVLRFVSPTVEALFVTQAAAALLQLTLMAIVIWRALPATDQRPRFRADLLRAERRFAAAVGASAILAVFTMQSDKLLLSGLLSLADFGYYTLAGTVVTALTLAALPVTTAVYPRMTQLLELGESRRLAELYHDAAQFVAAMLIPAALTLVLFGREIVRTWTGSAVAAEKAAPIIMLLAAGALFSGLLTVPASLQSAAGWPELMMTANGVAACVLLPSIVVAVRPWGGVGAAAVWLTLSFACFLVTVPVMHRRLLRGEMWIWYRRDVALPLLAALAVGLLFRAQTVPAPAVMTIAFVALAALAMLFAATFACDRMRARIGALTLRKAVAAR